MNVNEFEAIFKGVVRYMEKTPPAGSYVAWKSHGGAKKFSTHLIVRGDTLSDLATRYQVSFDNLKKVNGLRGDTIRIGQILKIPPS